MNEATREEPKKELGVEEEKVIRFFQSLDQKIIDIQRSRGSDKPADFVRLYESKKDNCLSEFQEFGELVNVIFGVREFVNRHDNLNYHRESLNRDQQRRDVVDLCGWQYLATEVLADFGWNKRLQDRFWREVGKVFDIFSPHKKDFDGYKRGVTGQARAFLILQELGYNPELASPEEDAAGVDFHISWAGNEDLIAQIKASSLVEKSIVEVVEVGSPSAVVNHGDRRQTRFQSHLMADITHLRESAGDFSQKIGRQIRSLIIIFSENDFDPQTGKPRNDFLEKIRLEIQTQLSK